MNRRWSIVLAVGTLSVFLLGSLVMMSDATQNSARFSEIYWLLLLVNALGLAMFIVLVLMRIRRLRRDLRELRPGARLTRRLLVMFVTLSLVPMLVIYGFSLQFLHRGIDSWFDVRIEHALADSLELGRSALDQTMRELLKETKGIAVSLAETASADVPLDLEQFRRHASSKAALPSLAQHLDDLRARSGADDLLLLTRKRDIVAASSLAHDVVPNLPGEALFLQLAQSDSYIGLEPVRDTTLAVRVLVGLPDIAGVPDNLVLQALYPISGRTSQLIDNVQSAYRKYRELTFLRPQLLFSFVTTLTLVLFLAIFSAVWAAFYSANRLSAPIRDLAQATRAVALGQYHYELPVTSRDELGFLVQSFNDMTRRIGQAHDEINKSRNQVDAQRAYLEAVLGRLSSGVLTIDRRQCLRTANVSAGNILGIDLQPLIGTSLKRLGGRYPQLQPVLDIMQRAITERAADWREQAVLFGSSGRQVLMCRGATLAGAGQAGQVMVFDDITALLRGQRDAAWSEVARRLAHEIKNPLTPIQLSAERLRHKYMGALAEKEAEVFNRLTNTIIQQVETMKSMVNTFSDYARIPHMQPQTVNFNQLVEETLELYRSVDCHARFVTHFDPEVPPLAADPGRMRQVLNNLIKNALDAGTTTDPARLTVSTRVIQQAAHQSLELRIEDNGHGIPKEMLDQIFEPYVTTKTKGTGLGLAIVKKIVEEHGGLVWLENNPGGGACAIIRLPLTEQFAFAKAHYHERKTAV